MPLHKAISHLPLQTLISFCSAPISCAPPRSLVFLQPDRLSPLSLLGCPWQLPPFSFKSSFEAISLFSLVIPAPCCSCPLHCLPFYSCTRLWLAGVLSTWSPTALKGIFRCSVPIKAGNLPSTMQTVEQELHREGVLTSGMVSALDQCLEATVFEKRAQIYNSRPRTLFRLLLSDVLRFVLMCQFNQRGFQMDPVRSVPGPTAGLKVPHSNALQYSHKGWQEFSYTDLETSPMKSRQVLCVTSPKSTGCILLSIPQSKPSILSSGLWLSLPVCTTTSEASSLPGSYFGSRQARGLLPLRALIEGRHQSCFGFSKLLTCCFPPFCDLTRI